MEVRFELLLMMIMVVVVGDGFVVVAQMAYGSSVHPRTEENISVHY